MKSKKTNPFVITTLIFFMTTVMFGLLTTGVIIKYRKSNPLQLIPISLAMTRLRN